MLWKTTALIVTLAIAPNAAAQVVTPPPCQPTSRFRTGHPVSHRSRRGHQNYVCVPTSSGHIVDVLRAAGHVVRRWRSAGHDALSQSQSR